MLLLSSFFAFSRMPSRFYVYFTVVLLLENRPPYLLLFFLTFCSLFIWFVALKRSQRERERKNALQWLHACDIRANCKGSDVKNIYVFSYLWSCCFSYLHFFFRLLLMYLYKFCSLVLVTLVDDVHGENLLIQCLSVMMKTWLHEKNIEPHSNWYSEDGFALQQENFVSVTLGKVHYRHRPYKWNWI